MESSNKEASKAAVKWPGGATSMEPLDEVLWQKFKDEHRDERSELIFSYAERWASRMQMRMEKGEAVECMAGDAADEVGKIGLDLAVQHCAVFVLVRFWKHGEELLKWCDYTSKNGGRDERIVAGLNVQCLENPLWIENFRAELMYYNLANKEIVFPAQTLGSMHDLELIYHGLPPEEVRVRGEQMRQIGREKAAMLNLADLAFVHYHEKQLPIEAQKFTIYFCDAMKDGGLGYMQFDQENDMWWFYFADMELQTFGFSSGRIARRKQV